jgi:hypothetical protein
MSPRVRSLGILVASATAGFASTLLCAWPAVSIAEGTSVVLDEQAAIGARTSKLGALTASSRLVTAGGRCFVETRVRNPTDRRVESAPIEAELYRTVSHPMARVMPMPTKVWQAAHVVWVEPGAELALRDELAPSLCAQVAAPRPPARANDNAAMDMQPVASFHAEATTPRAAAVAPPDAAPQPQMLAGFAPPPNSPRAGEGAAELAKPGLGRGQPRSSAPQRRVRPRTAPPGPPNAPQPNAAPRRWAAPMAQQAQIQTRAGS